jgi:hypothetical protein
MAVARHTCRRRILLRNAAMHLQPHTRGDAVPSGNRGSQNRSRRSPRGLSRGESWRSARSHLPSASLLHGVKWRAGDIEYETDHIAAIDKTVVIVEDKSATLSAPGLRGAPDRVRRHVRELIFDPSEQSTRLEAMIWRAKAGEAAAIASLSAFGIDFSGTECVVRISITLDDFSVLSSAEPELKEAGWIPTDTALAVTLNIADFLSVIDILERPAFFVHYFTERTCIQKVMDIFADEMDFLGFYLETGFNIWSLES